jgi:hypothetical protein
MFKSVPTTTPQLRTPVWTHSTVNQNPTDASMGSTVWEGWLNGMGVGGGVGRGIAEMSKCDSNIPRISTAFLMRIWKDEADVSTDTSLHINIWKHALGSTLHFSWPDIKNICKLHWITNVKLKLVFSIQLQIQIVYTPLSYGFYVCFMY